MKLSFFFIRPHDYDQLTRDSKSIRSSVDTIASCSYKVLIVPVAKVTFFLFCIIVTFLPHMTDYKNCIGTMTTNPPLQSLTHVCILLRQLVGFRYGKKHFFKIVKSLVTVLFKMTLHLCLYFAFTKNPIILSLFKIDTSNFTMYISMILTFPEGLQLYRLQHSCFPMKTDNFFKNSFFDRTSPMAASK